MAGIKRLPGESIGDYGKRVRKIVEGLDDVVRVDGQVIAKLPAGTLGVSSVIDELTGILKGNYDLDEVKMERLRERYGRSC